jgi:hypothetical protein
VLVVAGFIRNDLSGGRAMFQMLISYFTNLRVIEKNITTASRFSPDERAIFAEHLYINQRLIEIIKGGGTAHAPLDDRAINDLLVRAFHSCTNMGTQATALGGRTRRDPFLNLASTLQGLYTATISARHRPSHRKLVDRINATVARFVEANLTPTKRRELETDLQGKLARLTHSTQSGPT